MRFPFQHVEDLCNVLVAMDSTLDVIALRIGNVVSPPPNIIHKDGNGIEYPVRPATSEDVESALAKPGGPPFAIFPEVSDETAVLLSGTAWN